jgi:hypothetical protein
MMWRVEEKEEVVGVMEVMVGVMGVRLEEVGTL